MPCLSYTVHLTLYTLHCTPYTVHPTPYTESKNIFFIFDLYPFISR